MIYLVTGGLKDSSNNKVEVLDDLKYRSDDKFEVMGKNIWSGDRAEKIN